MSTAAPSLDLPKLSQACVASTPHTMSPAMALALRASFGSVEAWRDAMARLCAAPAGWAVMGYDAQLARLVLNLTTHSEAAPHLGAPLLAVAALSTLDNIAWDDVYERYQQAVHAAAAAWAIQAADLTDALVLDVRRDAIFEQASTTLPGAQWRDPAQVANWGPELPRGQPVAVYCIYGHEVGQATALRLRALGVNARYLAGGIDAWTQTGRSLQAKPS